MERATPLFTIGFYGLEGANRGRVFFQQLLAAGRLVLEKFVTVRGGRTQNGYGFPGGPEDGTTWYDDHSPNGKPVGYAKKIEQVLGGSPHEEKNQEEAKKRSPNTWLANAKTVPLDINHGIHDGRKGSVPFRHSLLGFNRVAAPEDQLPEAEILEFYNTQQLPAGWPVPEQDALYKKGIHFRKISGNARVTIFEGGHSIIDAAALNWLAQQRRGQPAVWKISDAVNAPSTETDSGK